MSPCREDMMSRLSRRALLAASGTSVAALAASGTNVQTASAQITTGPKTPFAVAQTTIPIVGSADVFLVRRIYCIGRNYAAHAREMGSDPTREPPFFFQKPTDAIQFVPPGSVAEHPYPTLTKNYHYEVELVAALKSGGKDIPIETALEHVYGYALGLDMTRRDLQRALGDEKKPWEIGKSFDMSAPIGPLHRVEQVGHFKTQNITLAVNGTVKQSATLAHMIWSVAEQIARLSTAFELKAGDIIYSGTPENVGPVIKGDVILCKLDGLPDLSVKIV
jgi:fumarylpyruvate hydrolase